MKDESGFDVPWLLDSNVFVYAYDNQTQEKHEKALALLEEARYDQMAYTSVQNLGELAAVLTRNKLQTVALAEIIADLAERFNLLHYSAKTLAGALRLTLEHGAPFWDAVIAQTMAENGIDTIVTENEADFRRVPGLKVINPFK